jgi:hypothetical protein
MLPSARSSIDSERHYIYAEPRDDKSEIDHWMFRTHFRKVSRLLVTWNAAVARRDTATFDLATRFVSEVRTREITKVPYRGDVIARDLGALTLSRAVAGKLDEPLELALGPGSIWTALLVSRAPQDGLRVGQSRDWAIDMTGVAEEDYKARVDQLLAPVNVMVTEAQSWPETLEAEASSEDASAFDRGPLLAAIDAASAKPRFTYVWRCPECRRRR